MRPYLLLTGIFVLSCPSRPARAQEDEDRFVRGKKASEWLLILRGDKDVKNRRRALLAVEEAGPFTRKIFDEVGSAMRLDSEEAVRYQAALAIGRLGAKAVDLPLKIPVKPAVDALIASLSKEKSARVREAVARALARIGEDAREAVSTLGAALKDEAPEVRAAAAEALFRIGPPAKDAVKELTEAVRDNRSKETFSVRLNAATAISRIGRPDGLPAVTVLISALNEPKPANLSREEDRLYMDVRRQMIETLGTLGDVAATSTLTGILDRALDEKSAIMGRTALTALTKLAGDRRPLVPVLVKAMVPASKQLSDQIIRCEAIHHLGQLGKELGEQRAMVVRTLRVALTDKLSEVRLAAVYALGELGPIVVGEEVKAILAELELLKKSSEKAIAEAAEATMQRLKK